MRRVPLIRSGVWTILHTGNRQPGTPVLQPTLIFVSFLFPLPWVSLRVLPDSFNSMGAGHRECWAWSGSQEWTCCHSPAYATNNGSEVSEWLPVPRCTGHCRHAARVHSVCLTPYQHSVTIHSISNTFATYYPLLSFAFPLGCPHFRVYHFTHFFCSALKHVLASLRTYHNAMPNFSNNPYAVLFEEEGSDTA